MTMKTIFKDTQKEIELVMPVMPSEYGVGRGINIETINIHALGDAALAGYPSLETINLTCLLPAQHYSFCVAPPLPPYDYVAYLRSWCLDRAVIRYIVTDTPVNVGVRVERIEYGENDGSRDVNISITLREFRELRAVTVQRPEEPVRDSAEELQNGEQSHVVDWGDSLEQICRKYYGDSSLVNGLAAFNNIANPHLIYVGDIIRIPPVNLLSRAGRVVRIYA